MSLNRYAQTAPRRVRAAAVTLAVLLLASSTLPQASAAAPTTAPASEGAPQGAAPVTPDYQIGAEDLLNISVWGEEELQREVVVRPDGGISFPLVGNLRAAGKSPAELEAEITARLDDYIPGAAVTVSVAEIRGMRIYVTGKVNQPGQFQVGRYLDVLQALTLAGGLTPFADEDDIRILRRSADGETVYEFDYGQVKRGRNLEQNIRLKPDDVVVVP